MLGKYIHIYYNKTHLKHEIVWQNILAIINIFIVYNMLYIVQ